MKTKLRNPFPAVGKVFKYEMLHSYRILLPVYAILLFVALLVGVFVMGRGDIITHASGMEASVYASSTAVAENNSFNFSIEGIRALLGMLCVAFFIASFVITAALLNRRFKSGLLGDEAYLNLVLPVTLGEHVWGRALSALVWALGYTVAVLLSFLLLFVRYWKELFLSDENLAQEILDEVGDGYGFFAACFLAAITMFMALVLFMYLVNAIAHLAKKHRTLVKLIAIVVLLSVGGRVGFRTSFGDASSMSQALWMCTLNSTIYAVVCGVATQLILRFKLNLE